MDLTCRVCEPHYVDYSYWNELSAGSHVVRDAVARIRAGVVVFGVSNDRFVELADQMSLICCRYVLGLPGIRFRSRA